jgi:hypothetical protein
MIKNVAVVDEFADTTHGEVGITCERNPLKNLETTHKFVFATKGYTFRNHTQVCFRNEGVHTHRV